MAWSTSGPSPQRSKVPGRKDSMSTSASLTSSLQQRRTLGLAEVDGHEPLVPADERPPQRDAILLPAERPERVTLGVLDLDDVRAEIREQGPDDRAREQHCGIDDLEPASVLAALAVLGGLHGHSVG